MNRTIVTTGRWLPSALFFSLLALFCLPAQAQDGGPVEVTGEASVVVFDDFQNNRSEKRFYIMDEKSRKEKRLYFNGNGEAPETFRTGQRFKVRGRGRPDGVDVESVEALDGGASSADPEPGSAAVAPAPPETRKVLTLLVDFNDAVVDTGTSNGTNVQKVRDRMYNETKSVAGLFFNASLGTLTLDPDGDGDGQQDVFHVYIEDSYLGKDSAQCTPSTWVNLASAAFEAATGKNVGIYRHRLLITPNYWDYDNRHCTWGGVAQVGCGSWCWAIGADPNSIMHGVIVHELGHNLGFNHARTDLNNNGYNSSEGTDSEYGDNSDMMGSSRNWKKFNAPHAEDKGWIDPTEYEIRTVVPSSSVQAFDLLPLDEEAWDWPGLRALKIERSSNTDYYVTYRLQAGDYNNLNSGYNDRVVVYYGFDNSTYSYHVATLAAGESFTDTAQDFVLTVTSPVTVVDGGNSTTAMGVEVCRQACSSTPAPSGLLATAAGTSSIQLTWTDNSPDEDGFDIERSPDGSAWAALTTVSPDSTAYLDIGLAVGTRYFYRVRASSPIEDSGWSNTASATTDGIPPVAAFTYSDDYLDVQFVDTSTDDGSIVSWSWDFGDGNGSSAQSPLHSYAAEGSYGVTLTVTDNHGESDSASAEVTVFAPPPPPFTDHSVSGEIAVAGSVAGSFAATVSDDGSAQAITERESGGKKNDRYSYLEHQWTFDLPVGTGVTLWINAWQSASSDGDHFEFAWSDGGAWNPLFVVTAESDGAPVSFDLGPDVSGTVYLRVTDTDQGRGNNALDTVFVDFLQVRVSNEPPEPLAGTAPGLDSVTATAWNTIELAWSDNTSNEAGFRIERSTDGVNFSVVDTTGGNLTAYTDGGLSGSTTYHYRVTAFRGGDALTSGVLSDTTPAAPAMTLSLNGYKVRGVHTVDLAWSGATTPNVEIRREGTVVATTVNDGAYTDDIGAKGGATYQYQVCESGGAACSELQSVSF